MEQKLTLTKEQEVILKGLSKEEREAFDALSIEKQAQMIDVLSATSVVSDVSADFVDANAKAEEDYPILAPNGLGCRPGQVFVARFLGTVPMHSKDFKENWDTITVKVGGADQTIYVNKYFLFEDAKTGKRFGLYQAPCLNKVFPKLPTREANPNIAQNPLVRIEYVGKIKGRDVLKEKYDLPLTQGNEAHVHLVQVEKTVKYDRYRSGCVNYLKSPIPNLGSAEKLSEFDQAQKDWAQLEMLNTSDMTHAIGGAGVNAQLEAPTA